MSDQPIQTVEQLEERLSRPAPAVVQTMGRIDGDLLVLGVGGKIGPSLARMARRASDEAGKARRVIGVSRFSVPGLAERLQAQGIETIRADLLDRNQLESLPDAPNVLYLAAMKFGATGNEPLTWAMNAYLPGMVAERFRHSRIVAYSTGNVYAMAPADGPGSAESDPLAPVGDYAMSCLGRERIFSYFSSRLAIPTVLIRLNYANELRYGVLTDLAQKVLAEQPIDLTMGYFNAIWQGDSNAMTLRALEHVASPPWVVNVAGEENLRVRQVARRFGELFGKAVHFTGTEAANAFLSNARVAYDRLGRPQVSVDQMIQWVCHWQRQGGLTLGKPTHFQTRNGKF